MDNLPRIALLGTFVGRGRERQVGEICAAQGAFYTLAAPATGTAASEVLQVLGIGETSRTLTLSLVPAPLIPRLRQELRDRLFMTQPGQGILFTVPLSGINARSARWLSQGMDGKPVERSEPPMAEANFELILALTNRGCSDEVMAAARLAGATGGTLLHTRMLGGRPLPGHSAPKGEGAGGHFGQRGVQGPHYANHCRQSRPPDPGRDRGPVPACGFHGRPAVNE